MGWKRTPALITELPRAPSMMLWLLSGVLAAVVSVLIFLFHASGYLKQFSEFNIWWVSLTPSGFWFILFCFRGWLWEKKVNEHKFLRSEAERAQKQWEEWAERYLVISASSIVLPDGVTAEAILKSSVDALPSRCALTRQVNHINAPVWSALASLQTAICQLPHELPVRVTLVTDMPTMGQAESFATAWKTLFPQREFLENISITPAFSMAWIDERLKQPALTVDLILVMQLCGSDAYSDGLAALLLTSDDVAQKFRLPHSSRLLRPMPLEIKKFDEEFRLFLDTQAVASRTSCVLCDSSSWDEVAAPLMIIGKEYDAGWDAAGRMVLEKWSGIPGPAAPWLLTALAADLVSVNKASLLTLFSSGEERFISTVTSGSEDEHIG